jgi:hypothetical protein
MGEAKCQMVMRLSLVRPLLHRPAYGDRMELVGRTQDIAALAMPNRPLECRR